MSATGILAENKPSRIPARSIALPVEHGAWGFLFEPLTAGLLLAPSFEAPFIVLLAVGAFLMRQPLKFVIGDRLQNRNLPRTDIARKFVAIFGTITLAALAGILMLASLSDLTPFFLVAPIVVYLIVQDVARKTRQLIPEVLAAIALASTITVMALAGGIARDLAFAFWALMLARLVPSILYVRNRLSLEKGKAFSRLIPIGANAAAFILVAVFYAVGLSSILTVIMAAFLTARSAVGLSQFRKVLKAKVIGVWEVIYGVLYALSIVIGYYTGI